MGRTSGATAGADHGAAPSRFVALLRGVNVGGRTLPMQQLRDLFAALGYLDVATYIQSGNVLFRAERDDRQAMADEIRAAIDATIGHRVTVVLRTPPDLERVIAANPYADRDATKPLYVTFLADPPDAELLGRLDAVAGHPDEFRVVDREVYVWCPRGYGRTVLSNDFFERRLKVAATTRNWRTVTTLAALAGG
jgi:uncharacterized protein (DUF1697 family)